ncbi:hypothetical protein B0F90DRAFT_1629563 [Multifurca ochricompacta]|uniref:Uncharacterized protein n=1 Tax=Multifurca ochricompacta TaxID=376703 RepID=A0AAD4M5Q5_9AGAM|nr:hypothetical protein B0F90DRAFT_1629563 [Multifurca ochricompacta]
MSIKPRQSRVNPSSSEETSWEAVEIVAEDGRRYRVRWAGNDPNTGKPWPLAWVDTSRCSLDLIDEWERKKGAHPTVV